MLTQREQFFLVLDRIKLIDFNIIKVKKFFSRMTIFSALVLLYMLHSM